MKYAFETRVRYSEIGTDGLLTPGALIDYFQDTATFQSEDYGVGLSYMKPLDLAWILSSWQIEKRRMPGIGEKVISTTWAWDFEKFYGYRNFTLESADGELLARANSVWVMMNMKKMLPVRVDPLMLERYQTEERLPMDYESRHIAIPEGGEKLTSIKIEAFHLDTNKHVNNARYVELALGSLPEDIPWTQLRVEYKKQALLGDVLIPRCKRDEESSVIVLENDEGKVCCAVELK